MLLPNFFCDTFFIKLSVSPQHNYNALGNWEDDPRYCFPRIFYFRGMWAHGTAVYGRVIKNNSVYEMRRTFFFFFFFFLHLHLSPTPRSFFFYFSLVVFNLLASLGKVGAGNRSLPAEAIKLQYSLSNLLHYLINL